MIMLYSFQLCAHYYVFMVFSDGFFTDEVKNGFHSSYVLATC